MNRNRHTNIGFEHLPGANVVKLGSLTGPLYLSGTFFLSGTLSASAIAADSIPLPSTLTASYLLVTNNINVQGFVTGAFINNHGSETEIAYHGAGGLLTGSSTLVLSSSNVGIGTANPNILGFASDAKVLSISTLASSTTSVIELEGNYTSDNNVGIIAGINNGDSIGSMHFLREGANDAGAIAFYTQGTGGSNTERMRVTSDGYLALGATASFTSDTMLTVVDQNFARINLRSSTDGSGSSLEIGAGSTGNRTCYIDLVGDDTYTDFGTRLIRNGSGANTNSVLQHRGTGNLKLYTSDAGDITLDTNATERMRVTSGGDVGIGTATPSASLDVSGDIITTGGTTNSRGLYLSHQNNINASYVGRSADGAVDTSNRILWDFDDDSTTINTTGDILLSAGNSQKMIIESNGQVGIGVTNPASILEINDSGTTSVNVHSTTSGGAANIEVGSGGSGNRTAYIDLVGDDTYTDFGTRLIRNGGGANTNSVLQHRGTGNLILNTTDSGPITFQTVGTEKARITGLGRLGLGLTNPGYQLHVFTGSVGYAATFENDGNSATYGGIRIQAGADDGSGVTNYVLGLDGNGDNVGVIRNNSGTFQLVDLSDERRKTNISPTKVDALNIINNLELIEFNFQKNGITKDFKPIGFRAQNCETIFPQMVSLSEPEDPDSLKMIARSELIPVLVKALQEQQQQIEDLKRRVNNANIPR